MRAFGWMRKVREWGFAAVWDFALGPLAVCVVNQVPLQDPTTYVRVAEHMARARTLAAKLGGSSSHLVWNPTQHAEWN